MKLWNGYRIPRADIPSYWTEYYYSALRIFYRFKRFGLPFNRGWAEHPSYIVELLELMDGISNDHERHEMERKSGSSGKTAH